MSERKLPKAKLDRCIELSRQWLDVTGPLNRDLLDELSNACRELEESVDLGIVVFSNLLSSILNRFGLKYDATNEDIYKVLEVLGWEVE